MPLSLQNLVAGWEKLEEPNSSVLEVLFNMLNNMVSEGDGSSKQSFIACGAPRIFITSAKEVMFSVFFVVCQQDNGKTSGLIFLKLGGRM